MAIDTPPATAPSRRDTPDAADRDGMTAEHPLSYPQEQLWLVHRLDPGSTEYNEIWPLQIHGPVDVALLERAVNAVVARHDSLRSVFPAKDGEPVCRVLPDVRLTLTAGPDLSALPRAERRPAAERMAEDFADEPYDLEAGPLVRVALVRLDVDDHMLLVGTHHIVADGWSLRVFLDDLAACYAGSQADLPTVAPYHRFARAQRESVGEEWFATDLGYWRDQLKDAAHVLDLRPGTGLRPIHKSVHGARVTVDCDPALARGAIRFAVRAGATTAAVLLAAFGIVVSRHAGRRDLLIGTGSEARPDEEFEPVIGFFANTLPLRLQYSATESFRDAVARTTQVCFEALDHQDVPFSRIVDVTRPPRDLSYGPLVQAVFKNADFTDTRVQAGELRICYEPVVRSRSRFDLIVEAQATEHEFRLWVEYDTALFDEDWLRGLFRHYENLLAAALRTPDAPVDELPMLMAEERAAWLLGPGAAGAGREVVLGEGGLLAARGVVGPVHRIVPGRVRLVGDRIVPHSADDKPRSAGYLGCLSAEGTLTRLGPEDRFWDAGGLLVSFDLVEACLRSHPMVRAATVRQEVLPDGSSCLAADLVPAEARPADWSQLRAFAAQRLPRYAVPAVFRTACASGGTAIRSGHASGTDGTWTFGLTETVRAAWCEVLAVAEIGPSADFFALGGHSMAASRLVAGLRRSLGTVLPVRTLFEHPTFDEFVAAVEAVTPVSGAAKSPPDAEHITDGRFGEARLTAAQEQIWVMEQLAPGRPVYHSPVVVDIEGPLDAAALGAAFDAVVERHEALRVGFVFASARPVQRLLARRPELRTVHLSGLPQVEALAETERLIRQESVRPFDLAREAGIRATLLRLDESRHRLLLVIHHIVMDGAGFAVFCDDLGSAYALARGGHPPELPAAEISWLSYSECEHARLAEQRPRLESFWKQRLAGLTELPLASHRRSPAEPVFTGGQRSRSLPSTVARSFARTARRHRATGFAMATAALAVLLHRVTGATDLPIGAAMANRPGGEDRGLVGCTANLVVLRLDCGGNPTFTELLGRVTEATLDAQTHQLLPFSDIVRVSGVPRSSGRLPLVQVTSEWYDAEAAPLRLADCTTRWRYADTGAARNELLFTTTVRGGRLDLSLEHSDGGATEKEADRLLDELASIVTAASADPSLRLSILAALPAGQGRGE